MNNAMELDGISKKLPVSQWQSKRGKYGSNDHGVGEKLEYKITHPEHILLYFDKFGNITCQKDDETKEDRSILELENQHVQYQMLIGWLWALQPEMISQ